MSLHEVVMLLGAVYGILLTILYIARPPSRFAPPGAAWKFYASAVLRVGLLSSITGTLSLLAPPKQMWFPISLLLAATGLRIGYMISVANKSKEQ